MTTEEIDSMPAGGEMDMLIARSFFSESELLIKCPHCGGWEKERMEAMRETTLPVKIRCDNCDWRFLGCPLFSRELGPAFAVVEVIAERVFLSGRDLGMNYLMLSQNSRFNERRRKFSATFRNFINDEAKEWWERDDLPFTAAGDTAPLAICRAALKTML